MHEESHVPHHASLPRQFQGLSPERRNGERRKTRAWRVCAAGCPRISPIGRTEFQKWYRTPRYRPRTCRRYLLKNLKEGAFCCNCKNLWAVQVRFVPGAVAHYCAEDSGISY
eukprot:3497530-Rhodomonas_salina.1